jgi:hypothetical protein
MDAITVLGRAVDARWRAANYDTQCFPEIAATALSEADLPSVVTPWQTVAWSLEQPTLPMQQDLPGRFSDLPLTVFNGNRFYIDVYIWMDGTTAIHQHGFGGAFQVVDGSSLHSTYRYRQCERINSHLTIGDLQCDEVELLNVGDVRQIRPGNEFIHALFHLDRPSTSVVVRTGGDMEHQPQFSYERPGIAFDPFFGDALVTKKLQALRVLAQARRPELEPAITDWLETADLQSVLAILGFARGALSTSAMEQHFALDEAGDARIDRILAIVDRRHGAFAEIIREAQEAKAAVDRISQMRRQVEHAELRFFLALAMNLDSRQRIMDVVEARFPGLDPLDKVLDWVTDLGTTRVLGAEHGLLGIDGFSDADVLELEDVLRSPDRTDPVPARVEAMRASPVIAPLLR